LCKGEESESGREPLKERTDIKMLSCEKEGWITFMVIVIMTLTLELSWARSICPADKEGNQPCECQAKREGVVLVCDETTLHDVGNAMKFFRERGGTVINYLTIRQSHVARIPNGFFMGNFTFTLTRANLESRNASSWARSGMYVLNDTKYTKMGVQQQQDKTFRTGLF